MLYEVEIGDPLLPQSNLLPTGVEIEIGPPVPAVSAQPLHESRVPGTRWLPPAQVFAYLRWLRTLTKTLDAQDRETREEWQKRLSELAEKLPTGVEIEIGPPVPAVSAQPLHEPRVPGTRWLPPPPAQVFAYLRWLHALTKTSDAQDRETREEWQKQSSELAEKSSAAESKPRVPGTPWLPPAQVVVVPTLVVHLDRPRPTNG
jgi:hypothetical protein